jgi:hypothetical protein
MLQSSIHNLFLKPEKKTLWMNVGIEISGRNADGDAYHSTEYAFETEKSAKDQGLNKKKWQLVSFEIEE